MLHDAKKFSDAQLLDAIETVSRLMAADAIRIERNWDAQSTENAQYWYEKRKPHLINYCQEYLRRNQNG